MLEEIDQHLFSDFSYVHQEGAAGAPAAHAAAAAAASPTSKASTPKKSPARHESAVSLGGGGGGNLQKDLGAKHVPTAAERQALLAGAMAGNKAATIGKLKKGGQ